MVVVGGAARALHHTYRTASAHCGIACQMRVDAVQQIEALKGFFQEHTARSSAAMPGGDDVQTDVLVGLLHPTAQSGPACGAQFDKHGRSVEGSFLFDKLHLFVPQVNVPHHRLSALVFEFEQMVHQSQI